MCDLTGFTIVVPLVSIFAADLAVAFMQNVLLQIGFCHMVHVDADNKFLSVFEEMCTLLQIRFSPAAKGNHQSVSVERFFRFANKAVTIATQDRNTIPDVWVPAIMLAAYAWNSSPIDGTDIIRSIPAVGRPFRFPLDLTVTNIDLTPVLNQATAVSSYLKNIASNAAFSLQIIQLLTQDRRTARSEHVNESRNQIIYNTDDLVLAQVQVTSQASIGVVAKLSYSIRGPFQIVARLPGGSYHVRKLGNPNGPLLKFPTEALQPCPPGLITCDPIDSTDLRYLNTTHAPSANPAAKPFSMKQYNEVWFSDSTPAPPAKFDYSSESAQAPLSHYAHPYPTMMDLRQPTDAPAPSPEPLPHHMHSSPEILATAIDASIDKLFFIRYHPENTLRPRWYLVQVDLACTLLDPLSRDHAHNGRYYVHFQRRHSNDQSSSDLSSRWWPIWHEYTIASDAIIDFGSIINFRPGITPDPTKYIAWSDVVPLLSDTTYLLGPFDFIPATRTISAHIWSDLFVCCAARGIIPPTLSLQPMLRSKWSRLAKRKR
jgi:hypothetical protein